MDRSRPLTRRPLIALVTAAALAVPGLTVISSAARAADAELARNGGFESGLDGWTCTGGAAVTTPVRSG
ncbi:chitinase, partial [Streptomyces sp. SID8352]|nr:chitinase [Streptomyces sp. SID8352]MYU23933.1 chitinase [Streptomyces sp. SID8352]